MKRFNQSRRFSSSKISSRSLRFETLEDRRLMAVGVSSLESSVAEGAASLAAFRVSTSETSAEPIELWLNASGAATNDVDYELYTLDALNEPLQLVAERVHNVLTDRDEYALHVTIPANEEYVDLWLAANTDAFIESSEEIVLTIVPTTGLVVSDSESTASTSLLDCLQIANGPPNDVAVSNLAVVPGAAGGWSAPGGVILTGSVFGANVFQVEISVGSSGSGDSGESGDSGDSGGSSASFFAPVQPDAETPGAWIFSAPLPAFSGYGEEVSIEARGLSADLTTGLVTPGAWTTISETPNLPGIATFSRSTSSDSGLLLEGSLVAGIGVEFTEIEFLCNNVAIGSTWTTETGEFSFAPQGIPVGASVITARAVYRPASGSPAYGASSTLELNYAPTVVGGVVTTALVAPEEPSTTTATPTLQTSGVFSSDLDVVFEYRWKLADSPNWSTPSKVPTTLSAAGSDGSDQVERLGAFCLDELYTSTSSVAVNVQTRAAFYDPVVGDYVSAENWSDFNFTYVPRTFAAPNVQTLTLATNDSGSPDDAPTLTGTLSVAAPGITVSFYETSGAEPVLLGRTTSDATGAFRWRASTLSPGATEIEAFASRWNPQTRSYASGTSQTLSSHEERRC